MLLAHEKRGAGLGSLGEAFLLCAGICVSAPSAAGVLKYHSSRNNVFVNNYCPIRLLKARANVDDQAVLTLDGLKRYLSKYLLPSDRNEVNSDIASTFDGCLAAAREQGKGLLSGMYKMFNKLGGEEGGFFRVARALGVPRPHVACSLRTWPAPFLPQGNGERAGDRPIRGVSPPARPSALPEYAQFLHDLARPALPRSQRWRRARGRAPPH